MSVSQNLPFDASQLELVKKFLPDNSSDPSSWDLKDLVSLLAGFVEGSKGILNTKYLHCIRAAEVIQAHPELRNILVSAWDRKEYDRVLKLDLLHAKFAVASNLTHLFGLDGVAVNGFYEYLECNHRLYLDTGRTRTMEYYAKFCSIVQSSGTGKTRVILELAKKGVLVLYTNLQPRPDKYEVPSRDNTPASILTGECTSAAQYNIQYCAFFSAIFKLIRDDLSERLEHDASAAVENWNKDMCQLDSSYRVQFFQRLQRTYEQITNDFKNDAVDAMQASSLEDIDSKYAANVLIRYYTELTQILDSVFPNVDQHHPKLVIALDEAHTLHEGTDFSRPTVLFRVIKAYSAPRSIHAVWVVFSSTTSKVADFAGPTALFASARVSIRGELIFPPFCQLGWDQHAPALGTVPLDQVAKMRHILRYGRPLWASLKDIFLPRAIFDLALDKLVGTTPHPGLLVNHTLALVVLAQRFGFDICFGHREAVHFVESTVASHMRFIVTTTEDRLWSYTSYPSEPLLSCAAASLMHQTKDSLETTLQTLNDKVHNGMIDIGQCGELVSRLIWLLAKDLFVIRSNPDPNAQDLIGNVDDAEAAELVHCRMVPLIQFFEFLFGNNFWKRVKDKAVPNAKEAFQDAYINFSHWVSMESFILPNEKMVDQSDLNDLMTRHWHRTSAVQCCHVQPSIDKVIPIYFKSGKLGPDNIVYHMSQILISDKACISEDPEALFKIQRNNPTIGGQSANPLPYIAILAELRLDIAIQVQTTFPTRASPRTDNAQCLRIRARGLSKQAYPFLKDHPEVLKILQDMLERGTRPPKPLRPLADRLQSQAQWGKSVAGQHTKWD